MDNFVGSLDTDIAIGSILSNFETAWVMHSVQDSLNMRFRPFADPMPNFVDILNRQFNTIYTAADEAYRDQVVATRDTTFKEIISCICEYYNLNLVQNLDELASEELYGIAHMMYDIFVSRFTDYMINFFIGYIIQNYESIYAYLAADETIKKPREKDMPVKSYIDPKFYLIHCNLNKVILNMYSYDIPLDALFGFFVDPNTAMRLSQILSDRGDIYRNYYAIYLSDQRYMAELLTAIKLRLQTKTQEAYDINKNLDLPTPPMPQQPAPVPDID